MSDKHTETPYVVNGFGGHYHVVARMQPHEVAISASGARGGEIETADFICRACNHHDWLVNALDLALQRLARYDTETRLNGDLKAALKSARGVS